MWALFSRVSLMAESTKNGETIVFVASIKFISAFFEEKSQQANFKKKYFSALILKKLKKGKNVSQWKWGKHMDIGCANGCVIRGLSTKYKYLSIIMFLEFHFTHQKSWIHRSLWDYWMKTSNWTGQVFVSQIARFIRIAKVSISNTFAYFSILKLAYATLK